MKIVKLQDITLYQLGESLLAASTGDSEFEDWSFWRISDGDLIRTFENMAAVYEIEGEPEAFEKELRLARSVKDLPTLDLLQAVLTKNRWPKLKGVTHRVIPEYLDVVEMKSLPEGMVGLDEALRMVKQILNESKRWKLCRHVFYDGRYKDEFCGQETYLDTPFCRAHLFGLPIIEKVIKLTAMKEAGVELTEAQEKALRDYENRSRKPISDSQLMNHVNEILERLEIPDSDIPPKKTPGKPIVMKIDRVNGCQYVLRNRPYTGLACGLPKYQDTPYCQKHFKMISERNK